MRRETAVEYPNLPPKSLSTPVGPTNEEIQFLTQNEKNPNVSNLRNLSPDQRQTHLIPIPLDNKPPMFKKSSESLQKNSSTDTEYSAHPYKFIKQSSNETNTSYTGSFNIDNSSLTNDLSLDADTSLNTTVIEHSTGGGGGDRQIMRATSFGSADVRSSGPTLRKQFSIDQSGLSPSKVPIDSLSASPLPIKGCLKAPTKMLGMNILKESSSSTESKEERSIPMISTEVVQDDIAKLSSNIKSSTDDEKDPPINETMC